DQRTIPDLVDGDRAVAVRDLSGKLRVAGPQRDVGAIVQLEQEGALAVASDTPGSGKMEDVEGVVGTAVDKKMSAPGDVHAGHRYFEDSRARLGHRGRVADRDNGAAID